MQKGIRKKFLIVGSFIAINIIIAWSFAPQTAPPFSTSALLAKEHSFPGSLALVVIDVELEGKLVPLVQASGFLVDRDRGIVATAAHLVDSWQRYTENYTKVKFNYRVFIQGQDYLAKPYENSINWRADIALLFLESYDPLTLPDPPELTGAIHRSQNLSLYGYATRVTNTNSIFKSYYKLSLPKNADIVPVAIIPVTVKSLATKIDDISVSEYDKVTLLGLGEKLGIPIHKNQKYLFFSNYILTKPSKELTDGLSGSPMVDSQGRVAAMHSSAILGSLGFEVPATEIISLLSSYQQK